MTFMPAAWQVRRARVAQEQWNAEHPDQVVPWEWVEEMLLAWRAWKEQVGYAPQEAVACHQRYQEFARKIPSRLVSEIFPQA
jgi:hypothetical protein